MIENGKVVSLSYALKNSQGEILDQSDSRDPLVYLHGGHQIVTGLETALEGLKIGEKKNVVVAPADGYGEKNDSLCLTVKKAQFPANVQLEPGMQFQAHAPDGSGVVFTIEKVEGDNVHINGNHPLAGQTLHFDIEVLDIRDASEEERSHGHAHGPDGHHHH
ncbi:MAG TPA: peptidylprolyl isomerase [Bdellovibrionales bacterium]|nr:MAG: peptidylprolyl isomerase [Bdellovibrionales bacterium GWB1_52_6]OFZ06476.1 MAG: peptidylprolyl isomerase [Bdellovibrionales bacterium GWA1_52_35]HAR43550.1 peptidylprolyl isomerase [Bdellovibrionales bacterium]HCM39479.1 peptidylprolyl isomerase [Bdellovibrionales bacterium]